MLTGELDDSLARIKIKGPAITTLEMVLVKKDLRLLKAPYIPLFKYQNAFFCLP
ncbi:hypothetical protein GFO_1259 [Christiangramia forsetii KT0803]|uniref:Uncharacterized protein n=1 Tax=Christiangramia forsetii (strain DSM 17595 / CGMCC 1.15422 / KT0803) TaxID=411154 RepID=A0M0T8_CHRFK|nr:hypothetical protein GFO_1259 [Christiangramia forsetii KT0803]